MGYKILLPTLIVVAVLINVISCKSNEKKDDLSRVEDIENTMNEVLEHSVSIEIIGGSCGELLDMLLVDIKNSEGIE